jgi:ketosteroid isomerase-like protein
MARTPQEVFVHHAQALSEGDLDEVIADYADNAVFITPSGVQYGKDAIKTAFAQLLADLPDTGLDTKTRIFEGDVLFQEWRADAKDTMVEDGIDTYVFSDGFIRAQTTRYTLQHKT